MGPHSTDICCLSGFPDLNLKIRNLSIRILKEISHMEIFKEEFRKETLFAVLKEAQKSLFFKINITVKERRKLCLNK